MTIKRVRPDGEIRQWQRNTAESVNQALNRMALQADLTALDGEAVKKDGLDIYVAPTISDPPTAVEVQAIADALAAVSLRLKG